MDRHSLRDHVGWRPVADRVVVAVDGPSGSGKSTVARGVATSLGLRYLDTGAMYRAVTWAVLHCGVGPTDAPAVTTAAQTPELDVGTAPAAPTIAVDGTDVTAAVRSEPV